MRGKDSTLSSEEVYARPARNGTGWGIFDFGETRPRNRNSLIWRMNSLFAGGKFPCSGLVGSLFPAEQGAACNALESQHELPSRTAEMAGNS
jgi:hypothetical protein